jgi:hypothetical protein
MKGRPQRSPQEEHELLDHAMALWALDTMRWKKLILFSETPALELVIWLNERRANPEIAPIRSAVLHLIELATSDPEFTPASSIMDLANWSSRRFQ